MANDDPNNEIGHFSLGDPTHEIRLVRQPGCSVYVVRPTKHTR